MDTIPGLGFLPSDFSSRDAKQRLNSAHEAPATSDNARELPLLDQSSEQDERPTQAQMQLRGLPSQEQSVGNANTSRENRTVPIPQEITIGVPLNKTLQTRALPAEPVRDGPNVQQGERTETKVDLGTTNLSDVDGAPMPRSDSRETRLETEWSFDVSSSASMKGNSSGSSSSSESDDSSTEEDGDEDDDDMSIDDDYELLDPAEQARILMKDDADDDSGGKYGLASAPRTANEQIEEKIQKPDIIITPDMEIQELGVIENVVESFALVKGILSSETKVLGSGSPLCLDDRTIIGSVAEPVGRVDDPRYSVAFNTISEMKEFGIVKGSKIFYPTKFADYVFTHPLKLIKGSDASNMHDEEVGREEIEFSDDEAEAAYKKQKKLALQAKKSNGGGVNTGFQKRNQRLCLPTNDRISGNGSQILKYEDADTDDPYVPLARPSDLYSEGNKYPPHPGNPYSSHQSPRANSRRGRPRGNQSASGQRARLNDGGQYHKDMPKQPQNFGRKGASGFMGGILGGCEFNAAQQAPWPYTQSSSVPYTPYQLSEARISGPSPSMREIPTPDNGQGFIPGVPPGAYVNPAFFTSQQPFSQVQQPAIMGSAQASHIPASAQAAATSSRHQNMSQASQYDPSR